MAADAAGEAPIVSTDLVEAPKKKSGQGEPPPGRPRALARAPECAPTAAPHTAGLGGRASGCQLRSREQLDRTALRVCVVDGAH